MTFLWKSVKTWLHDETMSKSNSNSLYETSSLAKFNKTWVKIGSNSPLKIKHHYPTRYSDSFASHISRATPLAILSSRRPAGFARLALHSFCVLGLVLSCGTMAARQIGGGSATNWPWRGVGANQRWRSKSAKAHEWGAIRRASRAVDLSGQEPRMVRRERGSQPELGQGGSP